LLSWRVNWRSIVLAMADDLAQNALSALGLAAGASRDVAVDLVQRFARRATLRTQFTPPVSFAPFAGMSSSSTATSSSSTTSTAPTPATSTLADWSPWAWIKPSLEVDGDFGTFNLETVYGPPSEDYVPHAAGLGSGVAAVVLWLAGKEELAKVAAAAAVGFVVVGELERRSS
jgi:hypothetical protein